MNAGNTFVLVPSLYQRYANRNRIREIRDFAPRRAIYISDR